MALCKHPEEVCCNMTLYRGEIYCNNPNGFCSLHDELPPNTNADRIRAMSDEELAEIIACPKGLFDRMDCFDDNRDCEDCALEWLKQPAEKDGI